MCVVGALPSVGSSYLLGVPGSSEVPVGESALGEVLGSVPGDLLSASDIAMPVKTPPLPAAACGCSVLLSLSSSAGSLFCFLRRMKNQTARLMRVRATRPPTTPPAIAAVGVLVEEDPTSRSESGLGSGSDGDSGSDPSVIC